MTYLTMKDYIKIPLDSSGFLWH